MSEARSEEGGARQGAELVRASQVFAKEDKARSRYELFTTLIVLVAFETLALAPLPWPVSLLASVGVGLTFVRAFILFHDHMHGAMFTEDPVPAAIVKGFGYVLLNPPSVWRQTHDYHHRNNARLPSTTIGSFPILTTKMWADLDPSLRRWYRLARHPITLITGYVTVFALGMCIAAYRRDPKAHRGGLVALAVHGALLLVLGLAFGWQGAVLGLALPMAIASALGSYLFYAQHNFPGMELKDRQRWDFSHAALRASSLFEMPAILHWFTGNIGYHHVHHLNHRIPFYRLPEAMGAMPELQNPVSTSWHPRDVRACLRLALWDADQNRMLTWDEVASAR